MEKRTRLTARKRPQKATEAVIRALRRNGFEAEYVPDSDAARALMLEMIPGDVTVGFSDSATIKQIGVVEALEDRGTKVINPFRKELIQTLATDENATKAFRGLLRKTLDSDIYLAGTNAITRDGKLVYIDGTGNRISAIIYAVSRSIIVAGENKIVDNVDAAIDRIKNVISPEHARRRRRRLPCAKTLRCSDCTAPERQCNVTAILERRPRLSKICVVVVGQDLGLGWDPSWPEERINRIREGYYAVSSVFPLPPSFLVKPSSSASAPSRG